jgi:hypothetical protein
VLRIQRSIIEGQPAVQEAFARRGIVDYAIAVPDGARAFETTQVFVCDDGKVVPSDAGTVAAVAAEVGAHE